MNINEQKDNRRRQLAAERTEARRKNLNNLHGILGDTIQGATISYSITDHPILHYQNHKPITVHLSCDDIKFEARGIHNPTFADALIIAEMNKIELAISRFYKWFNSK